MFGLVPYNQVGRIRTKPTQNSLEPVSHLSCGKSQETSSRHQKPMQRFHRVYIEKSIRLKMLRMVKIYRFNPF